ncbi:phosphatidylinositol mannoside acyltransferase [uncultured Friedmanniella sp.]|uniref:phosphatidylinositol mannoside acyltransferase n=1 Tax=uncultured Friedmanniella sp. TaxID=335381 RepID=UPI0035CB7B8D
MPTPPDRVLADRALADRARDAALRGLYRLGWRTAARVPEPLVRVLVAAAGRLAVVRPGVHVRRLRANLETATGGPVTDRLLARAVASYLRTFWEVLALPGWSAAGTTGRVETVGEHALRDAYAGPGAVVALPHSGNWDLAGAWACRTGMPVTTVAERLGDTEYAAFVAFRESLGMEVLAHGDPGVISGLAGALRQGRLVCLVADRDLDGTGVPVSWAGSPVTMPAGPAMVARRTGAVLLPAVCHYDGPRMVIRFGSPVPHRPGRAGLVTMTQQVADFFAARIAERPQDWHLMQPFFAAEPSRQAG